MIKLLYIQASPRDKRSHSIVVADTFVDAYSKQNPNDQIVTLNLFTMDLPRFDGLVVTAKYNILHGEEHSSQERAAWSAVESVVSEFTSADKYLLAVPMWNFGIPYNQLSFLSSFLKRSRNLSSYSL